MGKLTSLLLNMAIEIVDLAMRNRWFSMVLFVYQKGTLSPSLFMFAGDSGHFRHFRCWLHQPESGVWWGYHGSTGTFLGTFLGTCFNGWDGITSGNIRSLSLFGGQKNDVPWCTMEMQWRYNIYRWMVIKKDSTIKHGVNLCKLMDLWGSKQWWGVGVPIV